MPDIKLRIWTLGLRFAHLVSLAAGGRAALVQVAHDHAKNRLGVPPYWPAAFLQSGGLSASPSEITIAVDARCFSDPAQHSNRHLGFHGSVLHGMVHSRRQDFCLCFGYRVWDTILRVIGELPPGSPPPTVNVLSYCLSGRHRSVGVASLIWELARRATRWDVQMTHLSASSWWVGTCNNCMECQAADDPRKLEAFNAASAAADTARRLVDSWKLPDFRLAARG